MFVNRSSHSDELHAHHELHGDDPTRNFRVTVFYISIPICLIAILLDLLLIYFVAKYKALKTRGNYCIVNFCICNILFLLSDLVLHLSMDLFYGANLSIGWYCTFIQMENYFLDMSLIFITLYVVDEYLPMVSNEDTLYSYKNGFKFLVSGVYIVNILLAFIVSGVCFSNAKDIKFHISFIFVTILYAICIAIVVKIRSDCRKTSFKSNANLMQALSISLWTLLFFLPVVFYYNVISIVERIIIDENMNVLRMMAFISEYFSYAATFALAYQLYKINKFYRLAFSKIFCSSNTELDFSRLDVKPEADIVKK